MSVDFDSVSAAIDGAFAATVNYLPAAGGGSFAIAGIFRAAWRNADLGSDAPRATGTYSSLGVRLAQFPTPPLQGDTVTILSTGVTYAVREVRPNGHGRAILVLNNLAG